MRETDGNISREQKLKAGLDHNTGLASLVLSRSTINNYLARRRLGGGAFRSDPFRVVRSLQQALSGPLVRPKIELRWQVGILTLTQLL